MKIAVYSGSFDPLHIGHLAIMEYLTRESEFDWVYLVISPQNPLKDPSKARTGEARYKAAVDAVRRYPELHVWVDDIELKMAPPHYTIRTLDALKKREPENDFTLVIGADNLENIHKWRDFPRLLSQYGVAVYPRKGYDITYLRAQLERECKYFPAPYTLDSSCMPEMSGTVSFEDYENLYHIKVINADIIDISSTQIRNAEAAGIDVSDVKM